MIQHAFILSDMITTNIFIGQDTILGGMSKALEKSTNVENMTKEKMIEVIKASKNESSSKTTDLSSRNMTGYTSEVIEKIDSKIPTYVNLYSDLYKKYLHIIDNFYKNYYSNQKEIISKIGVNDAALTMFDFYLKSARQMALIQIDITENMFKNYAGYRLTALDFYDQMINGSMINFTKMLPKFNDLNRT